MTRVEQFPSDPQTVAGEATPLGLDLRPAVGRVWLRSLARIAFAMWACAAFVIALAVLFAWELLDALGVTENVQSLARQLTNDSTFHVTTGAILAWTMLIALAFTILATVLTVVAAALLNGIARVIGGIRLDVRRSDAPARNRT